jgi:hypothetical protein
MSRSWNHAAWRAGIALVVAGSAATGAASELAATGARVKVDAPAVRAEVGNTPRGAVAAATARGVEVPGRSASGSSSDETVASVDRDGVVRSRAVGNLEVQASVDAVGGNVSREVVARPVARASALPSFSQLDVGASAALRGAALAVGGDTVHGAILQWSALTPATTVDAAGRVTGVSAGMGLVVLSGGGGAADTAAVAVLGSRSVVVTALVGGAYRSAVRASQPLAVPVVLDLTRASPTGDLGSAQFDLAYDAALLRMDSVTVGVNGSAVTNSAEPGRLRFAFAGTAAQGAGRLTLATAFFTVSATAAEGAQSAFVLQMPVAPTSTGFRSFDPPILVPGRVRVVR